MTFRALIATKTESGQQTAFGTLTDADLMDGDVTVRVTHSTVNYKDGLAVTGRSPAGRGGVIRKFPMVPGIDFAGIVEHSVHPDYQAGDAVVLTGWRVGESHFGGYAQKARVKGDWLVPLPKGLSPQEAMAVGTAGLTAMLCVLALERQGLAPSMGPAVVTGAAGGVGSVAVALLAAGGWSVHAVTGRPEEGDYLRGLGAAEILPRGEFTNPAKPLASERWIAGVDAVGSHVLANVLASTRYGGAVAACGLAGGADLPTWVAPFILRGVSLLGIESVEAPRALRLTAWERIAKDLDRAKLAGMTVPVAFDDLPATAEAILAGKIRGRVVVEIG